MKRPEVALKIHFLSMMLAVVSACSGSSSSFRSVPVAANGTSPPGVTVSGGGVTIQSVPVPAQPTPDSSGFTDPFPPSALVAQPVQSSSDIIFDQSPAKVPTMPGSTSIASPSALMSGLTQGLTLELWFRDFHPAGITATGFNLANQGNLGPYGSLEFFVNQMLNGGFQGTFKWTYGMENPDVSDGYQHTYTMTYDLHNFKMYVDGELNKKSWTNSSVDQIGPFSDNSGIIKNSTLSATSPDSQTFVRITQRPLTPYEVRRNFESDRAAMTVINVSTSSGLQTALANLSAGQKIVLAPGNYSGSSFQVSGRNCGGPLTSCLITGADGAVSPTISSVSPIDSPTISGSTGIRLQNIQFTSSGTSSAALKLSGALTRVAGNALRIQSSTASGIGIDASSLSSSSGRVMIENSLFQMTGTGSTIGMQIANINRFTFRHNTVIGGATGLLLMPTSVDVGVLNNIFSGQTTTCLNFQSGATPQYVGDGNVYSPAGSAKAVMFAVAPSYTNNSTLHTYATTYAPADVSSRLLNTAWYAEAFTDSSDSPGYFLSYSQEGQSLGAITPTFVSPGTGNFQLAPVAGNPIDAGVSFTSENPQKARVLAAGLSDITGLLRPVGGQVDPGAYETYAPLTVALNLSGSNALSAGVYNSSGVLVRTLLAGTPVPNGVSTVYWNGLDDNGTPAPAGSYTVTALASAETAKWLGIVGSTSSPVFGQSVMSGRGSNAYMAFWGSTGFYSVDYNEASPMLFQFDPSNPTKNLQIFGPGAGTNTAGWNSIDTDGNYVYSASADGIGAWCLTCNSPPEMQQDLQSVANNTMAYPPVDFPSGAVLPTTPNYSNPLYNSYPSGQYPRGIIVGTGNAGSTPSRSVAVQKIAGDTLVFATSLSEGLIYYYNKTTGAQVGTLSVPGVRAISVDPATDSLWVLTEVNSHFASSSGITPSLYKYAFNSGTHTLSASPSVTVTGYNGQAFSDPIGISVFTNPGANGAKVLVADAGTSNQIKAFDGSGNDSWIFGLQGGYQSGGPEVQNNKWGFFSYGGTYGGSSPSIFGVYDANTNTTSFAFTGWGVAAQPDGSFWVNDTYNYRQMHFDTNQNYINQFAWVPSSYQATVDVNDPTRVFNGFMEYHVDYTQPFPQAWTLVRNWSYKDSTGTPLPSFVNNFSGNDGFSSVATMPNGKTYGALAVGNSYQLVELNPSNLGVRGICGSGSGHQMNINLNVPACVPSGALANYDFQGWGGYTSATTYNYVTISGPFKFTQGSTQYTTWDSSTEGSGQAGFHVYQLEFTGSGGDPVSTLVSTALVPMSNNSNFPGLTSNAAFDTVIRSDGGISIFDPSGGDIGMHLGDISPSGQMMWGTSPSHGGIDGHGNFDSYVSYAGSMHVITGHDIIYTFRGEFFKSQWQASQLMHYYDNGLFINQFGYVNSGSGHFPQASAGNLIAISTSTYNGAVYIYHNDEQGRGTHVWQIGNVGSTQLLNQSVTVGP